MVEVVLHLVVLREAEEVAGLHCQQVIDGGFAYAHHFWRWRWRWRSRVSRVRGLYFDLIWGRGEIGGSGFLMSIFILGWIMGLKFATLEDERSLPPL